MFSSPPSDDCNSAPVNGKGVSVPDAVTPAIAKRASRSAGRTPAARRKTSSGGRPTAARRDDRARLRAVRMAGRRPVQG